MNIRIQIIRFLIVGFFSAVIDLSLTLVSDYALGFSPTESKAIGFVVGTATAFAINRLWTFAATGTLKHIPRVALLYCVTFFIQESIYGVLSCHLPHKIIFSIGIYVIAQGVATIVNFIVQRCLIFKVKISEEALLEVPFA